MARRWFGWCLVAAWLVLFVDTSSSAAAPAAVNGTSDRLERTALLHRIGSAASGIEAAVWRYASSSGDGRLWIVSIDPASARLGVLPAAKPAPLAAVVSSLRGDFVAINGGFYDLENEPMGLVVAAGTEHARLRRGGGSGVFFVKGGAPGILHRSEDLLRQPLEHAVQSIDRLVDESEVLVRARADLPHDARSVVVIDWRGMVHLVAAVDERAIASERDGRIQLGPETTATGPTLWQIADFAARPVLEGGLGARFALNLDGGFSTALQLRLGGERIALSGYRGTINAVYAQPGR